MLQKVIARMSASQLTCRKWSVGLGTAVIGLAAEEKTHLEAALLAMLPAAVFWILDAYYLALERRFRDLFKAAAKVKDNDPDFSFAAPLTLRLWCEAAIRPAVWLVHLPVMMLAVAVGVRAWM